MYSYSACRVNKCVETNDSLGAFQERIYPLVWAGFARVLCAAACFHAKSAPTGTLFARNLLQPRLTWAFRNFNRPLSHPFLHRCEKGTQEVRAEQRLWTNFKTSSLRECHNLQRPEGCVGSTTKPEAFNTFYLGQRLMLRNIKRLSSEAGDAIRTRDIHLGKVTLYH